MTRVAVACNECGRDRRGIPGSPCPVFWDDGDLGERRCPGILVDVVGGGAAHEKADRDWVEGTDWCAFPVGGGWQVHGRFYDCPDEKDLKPVLRSYREMLQRAIAELDAEIAKEDGP